MNDSIWTPDKDGFPWNFALSDLGCSTIQANHEFEIVAPVQTNVTLALTMNTVATETAAKPSCDHSFAIHIDTEPIVVNLSEQQLTFMYSSVLSLLTLMSMAKTMPESSSAQRLEISERSASPAFQTDLKEFFGIAHTVSEHSSEETLHEYGMK